MPTDTTCPIWGTPAQEQTGSGDYKIVSSPRAGGRYKITRTALVDGKSSGILDDHAPKITTWLEEQRKAGEDVPMLTTVILDKIAARPALTVIERANRILKYVASKSPNIGSTISYSGLNDAKFNEWQTGTLIASESREPQEFRPLLNYLIEKQLLKQSGDDYSVSVEGWDYLEKLGADVSASEQAFVAMWFDASVADAYTNGIAPAIEDCGYRPMRIDAKEHINKIDDEIIAEIRRSKFLVADFTANAGQPRGGVYFEAGFAFGLNIPVIWTCRLDRINEVHFDTRQYNHITWETPEELRTKLRNRIGAVIGDGPLKNRTA